MLESTTTTPSTELPVIATQIREQLLTTVKQGQDLTLGVVQSFTKAIESFPKPELPLLPGVAVAPDLKAATAHSYDLVIDTLKAQREFAIELASAFSPAQSV